MAFPVFLDACTLYGAALRDSLLRLAEAGTYRPLWSADVLDELIGALIRTGRHHEQSGAVLRQQMEDAFEDAAVTGYETLKPAMTNHKGDRHVLAAAVAGGAEVLVTFNTKDFPAESVAAHDIEVLSPDTFLMNQLDLHPRAVLRVLIEQVGAYTNPPVTPGELLMQLHRCGVEGFAAAVEELVREPQTSRRPGTVAGA